MTPVHADEVHTEAALVGSSSERQFPEWAALPIEPILPRGTDNAICRVGSKLAARLPCRRRRVELLDADARLTFRTELAIDDATWARARGRALSQAVNALGHYTLETYTVLVTEAWRWLAAVLADST